jgi:hypothetical protein
MYTAFPADYRLAKSPEKESTRMIPLYLMKFYYRLSQGVLQPVGDMLPCMRRLEDGSWWGRNGTLRGIGPCLDCATMFTFFFLEHP